MFLIGDFISRLNGCIKIKKKFLYVKKSRILILILSKLYREGIINSYEYYGLYQIKIELRYYKEKPVFQKLKLISKPGRRIYQKEKHIIKDFILNNRIKIITTSLGLKTNLEIFLYDLKKNKFFFFFFRYMYSFKNYTLFTLEYIYIKEDFYLNFNLNNLTNLININRISFLNKINQFNFIFKLNNLNKFFNFDFFYKYMDFICFIGNFLGFIKQIKLLLYLFLYENKMTSIKYDFLEGLNYNYFKYLFVGIRNLLNNINFICFFYKLRILNFILNINKFKKLNLNFISIKITEKLLNLSNNLNNLKNLNFNKNFGGEVILEIL